MRKVIVRSRPSKGNTLELFRMTLYVFFPVAVFYYFNRPEYFDREVEEARRTLHPKGNKIPLTFEESEKLRKELRDKRLQRQTEKNNEQ